jgi:hypothetical protein
MHTITVDLVQVGLATSVLRLLCASLAIAIINFVAFHLAMAGAYLQSLILGWVVEGRRISKEEIALFYCWFGTMGLVVVGFVGLHRNAYAAWDEWLEWVIFHGCAVCSAVFVGGLVISLPLVLIAQAMGIVPGRASRQRVADVESQVPTLC